METRFSFITAPLKASFEQLSVAKFQEAATVSIFHIRKVILALSKRSPSFPGLALSTNCGTEEFVQALIGKV